MLKLARDYSLQATGLFSFDGMLTDASLAATGVGVAVALKQYPAAALVAAFPLFLIHRALVIPELRLQALRDPKTALLNMRGLRDAAETELARAERFMRPLSVIVLDIDDMRQINNAHGHLAGDAAIRAVADAMHAATRDLDLCARFGGDEFVLVLPETTADEAEALALRLHERVAEGVVGSPAVTVSSGVAELAPPATQTLDELLQRADAAMYEAKRGRATASV
jgi:diguanylate cyclase (GGDEF)-like protein